MLTLHEAGLLTTLQDAGRHGSGHLGIGASGAADLPAWRLANTLVGNPPGASCALEITLLGPTLTCHTDTVIALTGAPLPHARLDEAALPMWRPVPVASGQCLRLGPIPTGCRAYLAVAGGIDVPPWRGSRSTDVNAALGPVPRALHDGDELPLGRAGIRVPDETPTWSLDPQPWFPDHAPRRLRLTRATHTDALTETALQTLTDTTFHIGSQSNRVGVRLDGPQLSLREPLELVSEGLVPGVVQLPPDGVPIVMGPEHPVTGGYPRVAQVAAVDLPVLAQCRPGDAVRLAWIEPAAAADLLARREHELGELLVHIRQRLESA